MLNIRNPVLSVCLYQASSKPFTYLGESESSCSQSSLVREQLRELPMSMDLECSRGKLWANESDKPLFALVPRTLDKNPGEILGWKMSCHDSCPRLYYWCILRELRYITTLVVIILFCFISEILFFFNLLRFLIF